MEGGGRGGEGRNGPGCVRGKEGRGWEKKVGRGRGAYENRKRREGKVMDFGVGQGRDGKVREDDGLRQ